VAGDGHRGCGPNRCWRQSTARCYEAHWCDWIERPVITIGQTGHLRGEGQPDEPKDPSFEPEHCAGVSRCGGGDSDGGGSGGGNRWLGTGAASVPEPRKGTGDGQLASAGLQVPWSAHRPTEGPLDQATLT
jgi:hypothetical protein